jgi:hypothetical protein
MQGKHHLMVVDCSGPGSKCGARLPRRCIMFTKELRSFLSIFLSKELRRRRNGAPNKSLEPCTCPPYALGPRTKGTGQVPTLLSRILMRLVLPLQHFRQVW